MTRTAAASECVFTSGNRELKSRSGHRARDGKAEPAEIQSGRLLAVKSIKQYFNLRVYDRQGDARRYTLNIADFPIFSERRPSRKALEHQWSMLRFIERPGMDWSARSRALAIERGKGLSSSIRYRSRRFWWTARQPAPLRAADRTCVRG